MKKSNLFFEALVVMLGPLGIMISCAFGYEVKVEVIKKETKNGKCK